MKQHQPLVSIGMPVYNGERFLSQALESLLAQDYENFELIISDNASQDKTQEICLRFASMDSRVRYVPQPENLGAVKNFNWVFRQAIGKYFMWAAYDDRWEPSFVRRCSEVLEARRDAVLCCTDAKLIDERGHETSTFRNVETLGLDDRRRVQSFLRSSARCIAFYGLFRRDALLKTKLLRRLWAPDWCMLFELSFEGGFARIPENLLIYRAWGAKGKMDRSSIRSTYYSADTKIPPYPWTAIFLYSDTWAELFRISFSKGNGWIKRLELSWDVFRLYAVHWYQGICLEYYRRLYWYNESKDRGRTVVAAFFCFLFKPWCVFQYDFCCILLHAIMGEKMWVFCRKMKSSLGGEK